MIKKFGKKKIIIPVLCLLLLLAGCIFLRVKKGENTKQVEEEIHLKQGQSLVYGQVASIYGNEITYYVKEQQISEITEGSKEKETEESEEGKERSRMSKGSMPQWGEGEMPQFEESEMPQWGNGEMPQFEEGEMPQWGNGEMPQFEEGEMPQWGEGERPQMPGGERQQEEEMVLKEEKVTVQIPVGTKVTTRLGTETTFSRLAAGDNIKMLVQEENGETVILEIWIVD